MRDSKLIIADIVCYALVFCLFLFFPAPGKASGQGHPILQPTDCVKCHAKETKSIETNGGKHKTAITCLDCHVEHLPLGKNTIPKCSKCHSGLPHFSLVDCLRCHNNPHAPIASLNFPPDVKGECAGCHAQQVDEFTKNLSKHSQRACSFCHTKHGYIPDCMDCHKPHAAGQQMKNCLGCHPVHAPRLINVTAETPRSFCIPCHTKVGDLMAQTKTKHQDFTCAFCHKGLHPVKPLCTGCHGEPHSAATHKARPKCIDCHMDPHFLVK